MLSTSTTTTFHGLEDIGSRTDLRHSRHINDINAVGQRRPPQSPTAAWLSTSSPRDHDDDNDSDEKFTATSSSRTKDRIKSESKGQDENILGTEIEVDNYYANHTKDEIIHAFRQDLPIIMEEIFSILEDEQEEEEGDTFEQLVEIQEYGSPERSDLEPSMIQSTTSSHPRACLRSRFEDSWQQHCAMKRAAEKNRGSRYDANGWNVVHGIAPFYADNVFSWNNNTEITPDESLLGHLAEDDTMNDSESSINVHMENLQGFNMLNSTDMDLPHDSLLERDVLNDDNVLDDPLFYSSMPVAPNESDFQGTELDDRGMEEDKALATGNNFNIDQSDKSPGKNAQNAENELELFSNELFLDDVDGTEDRYQASKDDVATSGAIDDELEKICLLLERMSPRDWQLLDNDADDGEDRDLDSQVEDVATTHEIESHDAKDSIRGNHEGSLAGTEVELADVDRLNELLDDAKHLLSTSEYNLLLARVATSPELSLEDIMDNLLEIYHHLTKYSVPNETTYKIILLALDRRINAGGSSDGTSVTILRDMMNFQVKLSSPILLKVGMRCLERENNLNIAKQFIIDYTLDDKKRSFQVPSKVLRSLMRMIARENEQELAIDFLQKCIKENGRRGSRATDSVFDAAVRWPDRNRAGQRRDISHVLQDMLEVVMDKRSEYRPGFSVWRNLIVALSRTTQADSSRWEQLRRPFHSLFGQYGGFYPDEFLLRVGLEYCEATNDSRIARDIVLRSVEHHSPSKEYEKDYISSGFSLQSSGFLDDTSLARDEFNIETTADAETSLLLSDDAVSGETILQPSIETTQPEQFRSTDFQEEVSPVVDKSALLGLSDIGDDSTISKVPLMPTEHTTATPEEVLDYSRTTLSDDTPYTAPPFSYKVFERAIQVCLAAGDVQSCLSILEALSEMDHAYPKEIRSDIMSFALNGFARISDSKVEAVKHVFEGMKKKGMKIGEECYGAVIHSLAVSNRHQEARELFKELKVGSLDGGGVTPGLSCYNAMILSHLNRRAWGEVLDAYDEMKADGVVPNATTTQGLLISAYRKGGSARVRQLVAELLAMEDVVISQENCHLALKMLLPDVVSKKPHVSVEDIQEQLREMGSNNDNLQPLCLNLLRSFRQADIEQRRLPTKNAPIELLTKRREEAWQTALQNILDLQSIKSEEEQKRELSSTNE